MNAGFYFQGSTLDVGPTYRFSHTVLQKVATNYTESSPTNFNQF